MEARSLQAIAVVRTYWGDFRKALLDLYTIRREQTIKYGNDPRARILNKNEIEIASILYLQGEFDEALKVLTETLAKIEKHPDDYAEEIFEAKCYLAALYSQKMKEDLARKTFDELREFIGKCPVESEKTIEFRKYLAISLRHAGKLGSALEILQDIYQTRLSTFGENDHRTAHSHFEVAVVLLKQGKYRDALSIFEKVEHVYQLKRFDLVSILRLKRYLADVHVYLGLPKIAEYLYSALVEPIKNTYPFHPQVLVAMHHWGRSLVMINKPNKAIGVLKKVHEIRCEQSPQHPDKVKIALDIATIYANMREYNDVIINFIDVPAQISSAFKWKPDLLLSSATFIASIFDASQEARLKERLFKGYNYLFKNRYKLRGLPYYHKDILQIRTYKGEAFLHVGQPYETVKILEDVLEKRTLLLKNDYIDCVDLMKNIAKAYKEMQRYDKAFEYYSEVYEIQKLITGDNSMEAVNWEAKIREITNITPRIVLIDTVVSDYKRKMKLAADSENGGMEGNFPLHVASETGRVAMVKFLLFKGARYNEENSEQKTPEDVASNSALKSFLKLVDGLFIAVKNVDRESIHKTLDIMNDTRLRDDAVKGFPILLKGLDRIRDIVDKGILNARDDATGSTLLHLACSNGDVETVKRLLELEVDGTLTDRSNRSPRDVAEEKSFEEVLQLLSNYVSQQNQNLGDREITPNNQEMSEDLMDHES